MSRRTSALVPVVSLAAAAALVASSAHAAGGQHTRAAVPAGSVGLFAARNLFTVTTDVSGTTPQKVTDLDTGVTRGIAVATAINPVGGNDGLLCTEESSIYPVHGLRTTPQLQGTGSGIGTSRFSGEGGAGYKMFCYGVAVHGRFALATGDSQGLVQLIRKTGSWRIDKRVQSPGLNDAGNPHARGWIDIRDSTEKATLMDTVAIAPKAQSNGKFLAVTADREEDTRRGLNCLVVVDGVGTGKPKAVGAVNDRRLFSRQMSYGQAGIAFPPQTSSRAVVLTNSGFAVLRMTNPAHPVLRNRTGIKAAATTLRDPSSLAISSDGDHLAVAVANKVYAFKNVLRAVKKGQPFKLQSSFRVSSSTTDSITDLAYTANDTLVVLHGDVGTVTGWSLTLVKGVPTGHHTVTGSLTTKAPQQEGSLSVWPAP